MSTLRVILTTLLGVYLTVFSVSASTVPQASIRPLFDEQHNVVCTVNSINAKIGLWLTANHCKGVRFVGQPSEDGKTWHYHAVQAVVFDDASDLAVLYTPTLRVVALKLAAHEPVVDDAVTMLGFPLGFDAMQRFHGTVSNVATHVFGGETDYGIKTMYAIPACGGNSGGVVLNAEGEMVGLVQIAPRGDNQPCAPLMGGAPYTTLSALVGKFFEN